MNAKYFFIFILSFYSNLNHSYLDPDQSTLKRQETVYKRTSSRNSPSKTLQPYLNARPVLTKYSVLPIVDLRKHIDVPLTQQPTYNIHTTFNPGNDMAPWSGFASNINTESELRNRIYAIQDCTQSVYVPSSKSSLYESKWQNSAQSANMVQPFPELFRHETLPPFNPNQHPKDIGFGLFNNATRQQLKDLTPTTTKC